MSNHYERAFRHYLRLLRIPTIAVDESRRALYEDETLKSLDFLITIPNGRTLLVDVKGRQILPNSRSLQNWVTQDDLTSLTRWEQLFGHSFGTVGSAIGLFVFVYLLPDDQLLPVFQDQFSHADQHYACLAISLCDYREGARLRSGRWNTMFLPAKFFQEHVRPFTAWLT